MQVAQVTWAMCKGDVWCGFDRVDVGAIDVSGVYIIGYSPFRTDITTISTIYVGRGNVSERIVEHRRDKKITRYMAKGVVYVTWAAVPFWDQMGIERYLADTLQPLEGEHHPDEAPIAVNLPGGWV